MQQIALLLHIFICVAFVILILLQQGKGAEMGAAFGSGASQTLFGSRGSASFLWKITAGFALLFFLSSLGLGYLAAKASKQDILSGLPKVEKALQSAPVPAPTRTAPASDLPPVSDVNPDNAAGSSSVPPVVPPGQ